MATAAHGTSCLTPRCGQAAKCLGLCRASDRPGRLARRPSTGIAATSAAGIGGQPGGETPARAGHADRPPDASHFRVPGQLYLAARRFLAGSPGSSSTTKWLAPTPRRQIHPIAPRDTAMIATPDTPGSPETAQIQPTAAMSAAGLFTACAGRSPLGMPSAGQPRCLQSPSPPWRRRCRRVRRGLPGRHLAKHQPVP
jgi:hypothetical protein